MLHCLNTSGNLGGNCSDMTVLERQRARMKWQQEQQQNHHFSATGLFSSSSLQLQNTPSHHGSVMMMMTTDSSAGSSLADVVAHSIKPDPAGSEDGWPKLDKFVMGFGSCSGLPPAPVPVPVQAAASGVDVNSAISRTSSCPPVLAETKGKDSFKKRKADIKAPNTKVVAENDSKDKRIKVGADDGESKITGQTTNRNDAETNCAHTSKENSKASEVQKPDYIHVRARRGQATDSHSLAERVRREKISERMKYLQDLVPGCNKITGKAGMLDEIINYVQSLQRQVEFLSMKLAAVNPRLDFNIDDLYAKEVYPACSAASFPAIGLSPDMANPASYLQFNSPQQIVSGCGLDAADMGLRRTISAPVSMPETFVDSSCFTQILPCSTWEGDFQNLYNVAFDQARAPPSFPSQLFTGLIEPSNLKMEMEM